VEAAPAAEVVVDAQPDLVEVQPGVQVVYDVDEPIFFSDGFYFRFYNGGWYRSSVHTGGWVVYNDVPARIRSIPNPHVYAHYRPAGYTPRHVGTTRPVVNGGARPVYNGAARPGETRPVYNGGARPAPVYNGAARPGETRPVVNGAATHPVYNGANTTRPVTTPAPARPAPSKTVPYKKDDKKK
jgi:hypothetical protein